ncbi:MAG: hypothetical protein DMG72_24325 [Acidobacteria bacterium]|nr:MAG: hypothetical protein DMG72_24325 [Acidobacteriota bacterium]
MASRSHDSANLKFGPFEIDALAGRLFKSGIPIKLQPQPFRVLLLLLKNPGHVISREEIRRHLCPPLWTLNAESTCRSIRSALLFVTMLKNHATSKRCLGSVIVSSPNLSHRTARLPTLRTSRQGLPYMLSYRSSELLASLVARVSGGDAAHCTGFQCCWPC